MRVSVLKVQDAETGTRVGVTLHEHTLNLEQFDAQGFRKQPSRRTLKGLNTINLTACNKLSLTAVLLLFARIIFFTIFICLFQLL